MNPTSTDARGEAIGSPASLGFDNQDSRTQSGRSAPARVRHSLSCLEDNGDQDFEVKSPRYSRASGRRDWALFPRLRSRILAASSTKNPSMIFVAIRGFPAPRTKHRSR